MSPAIDLERHPLEAEVAGGRVRASMRGLSWLRLEIDPSYYLASSEPELAHDLTRVGRLLVAQRLQAQHTHDRQAGATVQAFPVGSRHRRELDDYNDAVAQIHDVVESPDGTVRVSAVGMADLLVEIRPETIAHTSVTTFERTCADTTRQLLAQHMREVWQLRVRMFDVPG